MKQLLTVLVAAMFAAVSVGAIAQDKGKTDAKKEMKKDVKKSAKKPAKTKADKKAAAEKK
jgi:Ni/Co efflux regulator RcnB